MTLRTPRSGHALFAFCIFIGTLTLAACSGAAAANHDSMLSELRTAITLPVTTPGDRQTHNNLVMEVVEERALEGLRRDEVTAKIGRGRDCSEFPLCLEREFDADDWVYEVGTDPAGGISHAPTLIVGFDPSGRVTRTTYITR